MWNFIILQIYYQPITPDMWPTHAQCKKPLEGGFEGSKRLEADPMEENHHESWF